MKTLIRSVIFALMSFTLICSTDSASTRNQHPAGIGSSFRGPIGLQLYSLRNQFAKDVPGTLKEARGFGFQYVELAGTYGQSVEDFKRHLDSNGLKPVSEHVAYEQLRDHID
ncbi:MAG: sugar phosphate isomerase/epimerase, partial [Blastocatellia bacterium]